MEIHIRTAGLEDLAHILRHRRAMFEEMGFRDNALLARVTTLSEEYFAQALQKGTYKGWLAENAEGHVVGGGGIVVADWPGYPGEFHAKRAWVLNMYTEPAARHNKVAKRLLETMVKWCRTNRFCSVSLHASSAGLALYEGMGFEPTNELSLKL